MQLGSILERLEEFAEEDAIHVSRESPITMETDVTVSSFDDEGTPVVALESMTCLLEIGIARDVLRVWSEWRAGRQPNTDEKVAAIVYDAQSDAVLPVEEGR